MGLKNYNIQNSMKVVLRFLVFSRRVKILISIKL